MQYLEQAQKVGGFDPWHILMEMGLVSYRLGNFEKCIEYADQSITVMADHMGIEVLPSGSDHAKEAKDIVDIAPKALFLKSLALEKLGKMDEARKCFKESIAEAKGLAQDLTLSGHVCEWWGWQAGDYCDLR